MSEKKEKFDILSVSLMGLSHFSHDIFSHFVSPLLPILIHNLGMNYTMGGMISLFHRLPALLNPAIGKVVEKSDNRLIICLTLLVTSASICCITLAPSYWVLCLLILIMGISACFYHIPAMVMTREHAGSYSGAGMSFFMTGGELARGFGPIIVLAAVAAWGERRIYFLFPIALVTAIIIFFKFRKKGAGTQEIKQKKAEAPFFQILLKYKWFFLCCFLLSLARAFVASVLNSFLPTYLTERGYSLWFAGVSLSACQFAAVAGTFISGIIADRLGKLNTLIFIKILTPILMFAFVAFSLMPGQTVLMEVFIVLTGFVSFSSAPVIMALMQDQGAENPTTTSSIYSMFDFITIAISLTLTGWLSDIFTMASAFKLCAAFSCIAVPLAIGMRLHYSSSESASKRN
ncbi:MAG: MFS transporter [Spirochaetia bacterium]|nr:MFS transporter [Spirochaetia bacterium]MBR0318366.1 MFS transporter [Spirochaetia bacterium]